MLPQWRSRRTSIPRVGRLGFRSRDEVAERLVDGRVERRRLIFGEPLLPQGVGAPSRVFRTRRLPFLERFVVGEFAVPECALIIGHRMRAAEEMRARPDLLE